MGLAALSLDALSSVAYGPEAIVLVLVAAGSSSLSLTLRRLMPNNDRFCDGRPRARLADLIVSTTRRRTSVRLPSF